MLGEVLWLLGLLVLVFAPGLCFIALFRLIDYVANDELVARVENGELQPEPSTDRELAVVPDLSQTGDGSGTDGPRCRACGAGNWEGATYCRECLSELP